VSKDAIFAALVEPAVMELYAMLNKHHGEKDSASVYWKSENYLEVIIGEYMKSILTYKDLFRLLFFKSHGSSFENFRSQYIDDATTTVMQWFSAMHQKYPKMDYQESKVVVKLHNVWMINLLEEVVVSDMDAEQMHKVFSDYITFEINGWENMLHV